MEPIGTQSDQNRPDYCVDIFLTKAFLSKIFGGEMLIRILATTLLQIVCENLLYFQVIFKSMKIADDTFLGNSECEWVKPCAAIKSGTIARCFSSSAQYSQKPCEDL